MDAQKASGDLEVARAKLAYDAEQESRPGVKQIPKGQLPKLAGPKCWDDGFGVLFSTKALAETSNIVKARMEAAAKRENPQHDALKLLKSIEDDVKLQNQAISKLTDLAHRSNCRAIYWEKKSGEWESMCKSLLKGTMCRAFRKHLKEELGITKGGVE